MIDIHPPQHAPMTRRDFFTHLGIVILGILIAIGLEQTVEWVHQRHQRHQLEEDLHAEMQMNIEFLSRDYDYLVATRDWAANQAQTIQSAIGSHTTSSLVYQPPPRNFDLYVLPNDSVWQHASESGTAALLPREEAQSYTLLYRFRARFFDTYKQLFDAHYAVIAMGLKFSAGHNPRPDLSRMNPVQLDEFSSALSKEATALNTNIVFCGFMAGAQRALLDGATSEAQIVRAMTDNRNPYRGWGQPTSVSSSHAPPN
jgi:type II secretory pathway pseudopilin PulG